MVKIHSRSAIILALFVVTGSCARSKDETADDNIFEVGNVIPHRDDYFSFLRQAINPNAPPPCRIASKLLECSGCNNFVVCTTIGKVPTTCGTATPFCVKNNSPFDTCSAVQGNNDACAPGGGNVVGNGNITTFTCTGPGYFPDPNNCAAYHICSGPASDPTNLLCPSPLIYDVLTKTCRRPLFAGGCKIANCTLDSARVRPMQAFGKNQQFFVVCRIDMLNGVPVAVPTIYKCADGARFTGMNCEYRCPGRGRFAHSDYPDRFFECNWVNLRLVATEAACPVDTIFNRKLRLCVRNPALGSGNNNNNGNVANPDDGLNAMPANPDDGLNAMPAAGRSEPVADSENGGSQEAETDYTQVDQSEDSFQEVKSRPSRKH